MIVIDIDTRTVSSFKPTNKKSVGSRNPHQVIQHDRIFDAIDDHRSTVIVVCAFGVVFVIVKKKKKTGVAVLVAAGGLVLFQDCFSVQVYQTRAFGGWFVVGVVQLGSSSIDFEEVGLSRWEGVRGNRISCCTT